MDDEADSAMVGKYDKVSYFNFAKHTLYDLDLFTFKF